MGTQIPSQQAGLQGTPLEGGTLTLDGNRAVVSTDPKNPRDTMVAGALIGPRNEAGQIIAAVVPLDKPVDGFTAIRRNTTLPATGTGPGDTSYQVVKGDATNGARLDAQLSADKKSLTFTDGTVQRTVPAPTDMTARADAATTSALAAGLRQGPDTPAVAALRQTAAEEVAVANAKCTITPTLAAPRAGVTVGAVQVPCPPVSRPRAP